MEVDGQLERLAIPEASGRVLDPLDLGIQALRNRVGDAMGEVGEDALPVGPKGLGDEARAESDGVRLGHSPRECAPRCR